MGGELRILRGDQHQPVGEKVEPGFGVDQVPFGDVVHPGLIGRDEHVGFGALLDLLGQRRRGGIRDHNLIAAFLAPTGDYGIERVLEACRGEHGRAVVGGHAVLWCRERQH
jgi:hypothetical protein